jgi:hypothetical protein
MNVLKRMECGILLVLLITGCTLTGARLSQDQVVDAVWTDLDRYTRSHNRANWEVRRAEQLRGDQAAKDFEGKPFSCISPQPPPNQAIQPASTYWYVVMVPKAATSSAPRLSPTAPPVVPEPTLYQAYYLVDRATGNVVARKLFCVIY